MRLPHHVYTTADRKRVVEETHPDVGVLLYPAGEDIPDAEAKRLGLKEPKAKGKVEGEPGADATATPEAPVEEEAPAESKAVAKGEAEDKAIAAPKRGGKG